MRLEVAVAEQTPLLRLSLSFIIAPFPAQARVTNRQRHPVTHQHMAVRDVTVDTEAASCSCSL